MNPPPVLNTQSAPALPEAADAPEGPQGAPVEAVEPIPPVRQRGRRWKVTLAQGDKRHEVDSAVSRLVRCQRRVTAWSQALPRLHRRWRRALKGRAGPRMVMLTLTYRDGADWRPGQIRAFMLELRKLVGAKLWAYAWVAEMQNRGVPHYHVLAYVAPGTDVPAPDEAGLWPYGMSRRETAQRGPRYIMTYVGKRYQKEGLPGGARMFAVHIGKATATAEELLGFRLSAAPPWLQAVITETAAQLGPTVRWRRHTGGGWVIVDTGELHASGWQLLAVTLAEEEDPLAEGRRGVDRDAVLDALYQTAAGL